MGKQTMGVPFHAIGQRSETKAYHIQSPQSPIVRTQNYSRFGMDEYPLGTNAVIAVSALLLNNHTNGAYTKST